MPQIYEVLVVEDSKEQIKILQRVLTGFQTIFVDDFEQATKALSDRSSPFDMILLDINLPTKSGYDLLSEIQTSVKDRNTAVFCISGRSDVTDKLTAFSLGADDYLTKPFDPLELRARIEARLKKKRQIQSEARLLVAGPLQVDILKHVVTLSLDSKKEELSLSQAEFKILACLIRRPEQVFTREQLLIEGWGSSTKVIDRVIDTHVCTLRKKMGTHAEMIKSVSGLGYKLVVPK